jgi:hypothetical protein
MKEFKNPSVYPPIAMRWQMIQKSGMVFNFLDSSSCRLVSDNNKNYLINVCIPLIYLINECIPLIYLINVCIPLIYLINVCIPLIYLINVCIPLIYLINVCIPLTCGVVCSTCREDGGG